MSETFDIIRPVDMGDLGKRDMRAQFAALPWRRRKDTLEVLLVTTRETGRWVIPKGWPMPGKTPAAAAAIEATEEAGVIGVASERCVGVFTYLKILGETSLPVIVAVFPLEVTKTLSTWSEKDERKRKWVSLKKAAKLAGDRDLARLFGDPQLPKLLR